MGMTDTQRHSIVNALEVKERNRIRLEKVKALGQEGQDGGKVLEEVQKNSVDWRFVSFFFPQLSMSGIHFAG